ncbi:hypothetical protein EV368DRAFT_80498 [Lentinula lateritia]|nr:hypothetical protein EV368DRAFT_80498 [Lentinula lateritia]
MRIPVEDVNFADLLIDLSSAVAFIEDALRDEGIVLWKDYLEAQLSSQLTLCTRKGLMLRIVRECREQIWPNSGFR